MFQLCNCNWRRWSGGAIALASSNKVIMLENAIYSVISPEGCATILWRDPKEHLMQQKQ